MDKLTPIHMNDHIFLDISMVCFALCKLCIRMEYSIYKFQYLPMISCLVCFNPIQSGIFARFIWFSMGVLFSAFAPHLLRTHTPIPSSPFLTLPLTSDDSGSRHTINYSLHIRVWYEWKKARERVKKAIASNKAFGILMEYIFIVRRPAYDIRRRLHYRYSRYR